MNECKWCSSESRLNYVVDVIEKGYGIKIEFQGHAENGNHRGVIFSIRDKDKLDLRLHDSSGFSCCKFCDEKYGEIISLDVDGRCRNCGKVLEKV